MDWVLAILGVMGFLGFVYLVYIFGRADGLRVVAEEWNEFWLKRRD